MTRSDMSTSEGGPSNDSLISISNCLESGLRHRKIANSLQAGLLGHAAFLDSQERSVVVPMSRVLQRHYVRRSVPSKNVLENEADTEGMSEDEKLRRSKRTTRALDDINWENRERLRSDRPVHKEDRDLAIFEDERNCYERLAETCDDNLVYWLYDANRLSADYQYEVEQLSARLLWTSPDTAAASLFVRLTKGMDSHPSSAAPCQTSTSKKSLTSASRRSKLARSGVKLQRLRAATTSLFGRFKVKVKDTHPSSAGPGHTSTSEESRISASRHSVLATIEIRLHRKNPRKSIFNKEYPEWLVDGGTEWAWRAGGPEPGPESDWNKFDTKYKGPRWHGDWAKEYLPKISGSKWIPKRQR